MPAYDVVLKRVAPIQVVQIRSVAPTMEQIGLTLDRLFDQVMEYITQQGAIPVMPAITVFYDPEFCDHDVNVGACLAFEGSLRSSEVKVEELPGFETVASVIHHGSFNSMSQAYNAIFKWIETHDYSINGPNRELNLEYERGGDQSKFVTELQFPVRKN